MKNENNLSDNHKTSRKYEKLIAVFITQSFEGAKGIELLEVAHDKKMTGLSGYKHQIDVMYRFRVWNIDILVIVECKQLGLSQITRT